MLEGREGYQQLGVSVAVPHPVSSSVEISQSPSIETRGKFQQNQVEEYCKRHGLHHSLFTLPDNATQRDLLFRHLIFDDKRRSLFCFVEKVGCTDMKRLMFVTAGVLPVETANQEWVDLKYLEKGLRKASLLNKTLTPDGRMERIRDYFKFMIVRNPLERLVSGYRNKIESPLIGTSTKFPNYVKREILQKYRPLDFMQWLNKGGSYNISISFPEFVQYIIDTKKELLNPHFKPMVDTCHPCRVKYHFYGNFKTYSRDARLIIDKLKTKPEYYPNRSLHRSGQETHSLLPQYYDQLTRGQRTALFRSIAEELEFYYSLYPAEKNSHVELLGVREPLSETVLVKSTTPG